jgi:predicted nucleotidyltransferase
LRRWREYAEKIAKAVEDLVPEAEVYVIGGVAEGRTTIYSDIDVLIAIPARVLDDEAKKNLAIEVLEKAIDVYGLPWDAPVEVHVADAKTLERYMKACRKMILVKKPLTST